MYTDRLTDALKGKTIQSVDVRHHSVSGHAGISPGSIVFIEFDDGSAVELTSSIGGHGGQWSTIRSQVLSKKQVDQFKAHLRDPEVFAPIALSAYYSAVSREQDGK